MPGCPPSQPRVGWYAEAGLRVSGCATKTARCSTSTTEYEGKNMETSTKGTPDQRIASTAKVWRQRDQVAIADKGDVNKQRAEFMARQQLRKTIDEAAES